MTKKIDLDLVLSYPMQENEAEAENIAEYLHALLHTLWHFGESSPAKRPFSSSEWDKELYIPLVAGGFIDGSLDENGNLESCNFFQGSVLIFDCIDHVFRDYRN